MTKRYSLLFCIGVLLVGMYCGYVIGDLVRHEVKSESVCTEGMQRPDWAKYEVDIDGYIYFCTDIEYVAGFPMIAILHDPHGVVTIKAEKYTDVKEVK